MSHRGLSGSQSIPNICNTLGSACIPDGIRQLRLPVYLKVPKSVQAATTLPRPVEVRKSAARTLRCIGCAFSITSAAPEAAANVPPAPRNPRATQNQARSLAVACNAAPIQQTVAPAYRPAFRPSLPVTRPRKGVMRMPPMGYEATMIPRVTESGRPKNISHCGMAINPLMRETSKLVSVCQLCTAYERMILPEREH